MFKKIFGLVLLAHILVIAYFGLRPGESERAPPATSAETSGSPSPFSSDNGASELEQDDILEAVVPKKEIVVPTEFSPAVFSELPAGIDSATVGTGFLFDATHNRVLWEKESEKPVRIASMTKMMTALLAFEDIENRDDLSLDTVIKVTNAAYRMGGSQVWLDPRESFSLRDLLITIMVKSANDSSYLVGEYLADGDMPGFIQRMNDRAAELKMTSTHFLNAHGLPEGDTGNEASCQDLARLAFALLQFEKAAEWASLPKYTFRAEADQPTILDNHNRLVETTNGVDGMKTGYTRAAGYCVTATALRDDRRLIAVTTGFKSSKQRDAFTKALIDWGYRQD